jgi:hypothetical protein
VVRRYAITDNDAATRKPTEEFGSVAYKEARFFFSKLSGPFLGLTHSPYTLNTRWYFFGVKATGSWSCQFASSVARSSTRVFIYGPILFKILSVHLMKKAVAAEGSNVYSAMCVLLGRGRKSFYLLVVLKVAPFSRNSIVHGWIQTCISPYGLLLLLCLILHREQFAASRYY